MTCEFVRPLLVTFADAEPADQAVQAHLARCPSCRHALAVQRVARQALRTAGPSTRPPVPPGLRTRLAAQLAAEVRADAPPVGWRTRLSAFAAAAIVVLIAGATALPLVTGRSTIVLAAQMALDHLKCFTIDGHDHGDTLTVAEAESRLLDDYGWRIDVPESAGTHGGRLVAVRRCLYGDGRAAHLLYRVDGRPVSLFILPGLERPAADLQLFGQDEVIWAQGGHTYLLVAEAGSGPRLREMAAAMQAEAQ